jgi:hypothetical protein
MVHPNKVVGHSLVVEVGRWARPGVEKATTGLDLCCILGESRAEILPGEVGERVADI